MPLRRRRWLLLVAVTGAVGLSVGGLGASTLVKSPAQAAAEAAAPTPSVVTAEVERRVLSQTVVLRGTVAPDRTVEVMPPAAEDAKAVVTRLPVKQGQSVRAGTVVAEISGRPVIALPGPIPLYRDIQPGMAGPDVEQLQSALRELGYSVTDEEGTYGPSTEMAVKELYEDRGYAPPTRTETVEQPSAPEQEPEPEPTAAPDPAGGLPATEEPVPQEPVERTRYWLRAGEVAFVPSLPALVATSGAGLGTEVTGSVLTLSVGDLVVRGTLPAADRKLVKEEMDVQILSEETELQATGRLTSIGAYSAGGASEEDDSAADTGDTAEAQPGHPVVVRGVKPLSAQFSGQDVRLTIEAASTDGEVLVVPASAVYATADGSTQVIELLSDGSRRPVPVTAGASAAGYVEVRGDGLAEGDRVVVGK
ncbi:peptidoglycan-binding protein [Streptomyces sp. NPDC056716]|uniref:peptidoglycan-binding protein n=1 Tax=unclassified Streptomyces TaxID=2593676 RepID=UPI00368F2320